MPLSSIELGTQQDHPDNDGPTKVTNIIWFPSLACYPPFQGTPGSFGGVKVTNSCFPQSGPAVRLRTKTARFKP